MSVVKILLEHRDLSIDMTDSEGRSALWHASVRGHLEIAQQVRGGGGSLGARSRSR
jgi:hypothetical protein